MNLKKLYLSRKDWGDRKGQLEGTLTVDGPQGEVTININEEQARRLVVLVADCLVETTKTVAQNITSELLTQDENYLLEQQKQDEAASAADAGGVPF